MMCLLPGFGGSFYFAAYFRVLLLYANVYGAVREDSLIWYIIIIVIIIRVYCVHLDANMYAAFQRRALYFIPLRASASLKHTTTPCQRVYIYKSERAE